jgi:hypothetical protein
MAEQISIDSWSMTGGHMGTQQDEFPDGTWAEVEAQENPQNCGGEGGLVPMTAAQRWVFTNIATEETKEGTPPIGDPAPAE